MTDGSADYADLTPARPEPPGIPTFTAQLPQSRACGSTVDSRLDLASNQGSWAAISARRSRDPPGGGISSPRRGTRINAARASGGRATVDTNGTTERGDLRWDPEPVGGGLTPRRTSSTSTRTPPPCGLSTSPLQNERLRDPRFGHLLHAELWMYHDTGYSSNATESKSRSRRTVGDLEHVGPAVPVDGQPAGRSQDVQPEVMITVESGVAFHGIQQLRERCHVDDGA